MYLQQGDQLNQADQNTEIIFFENINYHKSVMLIQNLILQYGKLTIQIFIMMVLFV